MFSISLRKFCQNKKFALHFQVLLLNHYEVAKKPLWEPFPREGQYDGNYKIKVYLQLCT